MKGRVYMEEQQHYQQAPVTNGKAIASLVLGILSIVIPWIGFIFGIIGIVLSSKAKKEIANYQQAGNGMAVAGLVTSIVGTALYGLLLILLIFFSIAVGNSMY
ncbi:MULTISPECIES: DUF4190 domain-containing protein [Paraliobacillus]|uniref:DUF4190 domain-containing protein n=1 Tax=Paraliobacillus TaxID=200903 RepID=UPI000DD43D29|nr:MULTISPECIES: DUF4190 domain-containing protein [Paraliobacillus]